LHCLIDLVHLKREKEQPMTENLSFSVILEPQEGGGFTFLVPALPEVVTEGDTEEEALANAREALRAILDYRRDHGIAIPPDAPPEIRRVIVAA
jgi:antitoxin HicB